MKSFMILGAVVGFLIGTCVSLMNESSWSTVLWHACAAALLFAILTRWWSSMWLQNLQDATEQRRRARFAPPANNKPAAKA